MLNITFLFIFAAISVKNAYAVTDEEKEAVHNFVMPLVKDCAEEFDVELGEIKTWKKDVTDSCFKACILQKTGTLKDGLIDKEAILEEIDGFIHDKDDVEKFHAVAQDCATEANESDVSDDDKGCDRANIFLECMKKKKDEAGIDWS